MYLTLISYIRRVCEQILKHLSDLRLFHAKLSVFNCWAYYLQTRLNQALRWFILKFFIQLIFKHLQVMFLPNPLFFRRKMHSARHKT